MKITSYPYSNTFTKETITIHQPQGYDVLVELKAIGLNPIDTKIKKNIKVGESRILGWDGAGIIHAIGDQVLDFKVGDKVFYAGALNRDGSNATYQLVDSRLIAQMPKSLDFKASAALPLTSLTAYEGLFDRMNISQDPKQNKDKSILIINGAGGVGSMAIQLAKLVGLKVIATASRAATQAWVKQMGADEVVNHYEDYQIDPVDYIFCLHTPDNHLKKMSELIKPFGKICAIVDSEGLLNMNLFKAKSVSWLWEFMFTHSNFQVNVKRQGEILKHIAQLVDAYHIKSTLYQTLSPLSVDTLKQAHEIIESNQAIGKLVIENN